MAGKSTPINVARCFIVRIYRESAHQAESFLGVVEEVGKPGTRTFKTIKELWTIISHSDDKK